MADAEVKEFIGAMARNVELELSPSGGRVFVSSASPERLDGTSIELKCSWSSFATLFSLHITIGEEKHLVPLLDDEEEDDREREEEIGWRLTNCPIMLTLYPVDEKWFSESAARNDGEPILGRLNYYPPVKTSDGVVNDDRPTVTAWVGIGRDNFNLVREQMLSNEKPTFNIGLSVDFPEGSVEQKTLGRSIQWDGKGQLPVTGATIVWRNNDWSADFDTRKSQRRMERRKAELLPPDPPIEHTQTLNAITRLESAVNKLTTPIWLAAAAAIAALFLR